MQSSTKKPKLNDLDEEINALIKNRALITNPEILGYIFKCLGIKEYFDFFIHNNKPDHFVYQSDFITLLALEAYEGGCWEKVIDDDLKALLLAALFCKSCYTYKFNSNIDLEHFGFVSKISEKENMHKALGFLHEAHIACRHKTSEKIMDRTVELIKSTKKPYPKKSIDDISVQVLRDAFNVVIYDKDSSHYWAGKVLDAFEATYAYKDNQLLTIITKEYLNVPMYSYWARSKAIVKNYPHLCKNFVQQINLIIA